MVSVEFGTDGPRGAWGDVITPESGVQIGAAAASVLGLREWVLVQDTREFNPELAEAVKDGLASQGAVAVDLGVLPTPAAALLASKLSRGSDQPWGAISLSASHNPAGDAGIKVFGADGNKLNDETTKQLQAAANEPWERYKDSGRLLGQSASLTIREFLRQDYIDIVLSSVYDDLRISQFLLGKTFVLDTANGAAHWSAPRILKQLGANVISMNDDPTGEINEDCGATKPSGMQQKTRDVNASYGMALDGDADRLIAFARRHDGQERLLDGDDALAIAAIGLDKIGKLRGRGIVVTAYSNLGLERLMNQMSVEYVEVENGDRYVAEGMDKHGYPIGGENSGHTLFSNVAEQMGLVRSGDGMITALQELQYETLLEKPLTEISDWEKLPHMLTNLRLPAGTKAKELMSRPKVSEAVQRIQANLGKDGKSLVRASGTEPVVRVLVKHVDQSAAETVTSELETVLKNAVN